MADPAPAPALAEAGPGALRYLRHGRVVEPEGRRAELIERADVVIASATVDPLPDIAVADGSGPIVVEISPFGRSGPRSSFRSSDLVDQALSGHLYLTGDPEREPVRGPEHQVAYAAGLHGAIGALAAVAARHRHGRAQRVEVTHLEVMVALHQFTLLRYTHNGDVLGRMGNRYAGPGRPIGAYRCGDRMISLVVPRDDQLDRLLGVAGLDWLLDEPGIGTTYDLMHHPSLLDDHLRPWLAEQDPDDTVELLQALRVPAGPVSSMADLLADPQLRARGFWRSDDGGPVAVTVPGPPYTIEPRPPRPGRPGWWLDREPPPVAGEREAGPLAGLRVLDLTRVWAGPLATRILADLGAEVIMVEAPWARGPAGIDASSVAATRYYPDNDGGSAHWNRIGFINKYAINKASVALDLTDDEARAAFETLVEGADVVIENYSPRVMPQLGLDENRLHELNPSLVYVTMPGFGRTGPATDRVAYGPMIDSHAGLSVLAGYPDDLARKGGVAWPDPVAGLHATVATLRALLVAGRGATVEVAQLEATVALVGHAIVDAQLTGREPDLIGNRHDRLAPQGVYRCRGDDRWLAVSVTDDRAWSDLVAVLATDSAQSLSPEWDLDRRRVEHDRIDRVLGRWCAGRDPVEAMEVLQAAGVPAGVVADAADVMADPHLRARNAFVALDHPEAGCHEWPRLPIGLSGTPATYRRPAPTLNQDGDDILRRLAGLDDDALTRLRSRRALTDHPPP